LPTFPTTAIAAGAGFATPDFTAVLAAVLAMPDFATTGFNTRFEGTAFTAGFTGFDAARVAVFVATRFIAGRAGRAFAAVLRREDTEARADLPTFAFGRTARVRAALVLRELAIKCYLLQAGLCPVLMRPDPIDGRFR